MCYLTFPEGGGGGSKVESRKAGGFGNGQRVGGGMLWIAHECVGPVFLGRPGSLRVTQIPLPVVSSSSYISAGRGASHLLAPFQRRAYTCEPVIGVAGVLSYFACGWPFAKTRHEKYQKWCEKQEARNQTNAKLRCPMFVSHTRSLPRGSLSPAADLQLLQCMRSFIVGLSLLSRDFWL